MTFGDSTYRCGNYSREETIQGRKLFAEIRYLAFMIFKNMFHFIGKNKTADPLQTQVRIVCWILTYPDNHAKKAAHVKATWGQRCNRLIFMSSVNGELTMCSTISQTL